MTFAVEIMVRRTKDFRKVVPEVDGFIYYTSAYLGRDSLLALKASVHPDSTSRDTSS